MATHSKASIQRWVNDTLGSNYPELVHIPAKAAARLLNAMHGPDRAPLNDVNFDDSAPFAAVSNCAVVVALAQRLGCQTTLDPTNWWNGKDFVGTLVLWRWIRQNAETHPIPNGFDFSMTTVAANATPPLAVPQQQPQQPQPSAAAVPAASAWAPPAALPSVLPSQPALPSLAPALPPGSVLFEVKASVPVPVFASVNTNMAARCEAGCGRLAKRLESGTAKALAEYAECQRRLLLACRQGSVDQIADIFEEYAHL